MKLAILTLLLLCASRIAAASATLPATPEALAAVLGRERVVVLGEVHDHPGQHALRAAALRALVESGARPAIAFEQFDRERQEAIDRARKERPRDVDYLIAQARGAPSWNWAFYKPFVALALEFDLPIVAANLSRADAMRVAREGYAFLFDERVRMERNLDSLPEWFLRVHQQAIADGHCGVLPASALPAMARAQVARDLVMAQALQPYLAQGVILLAGNGHARIDIGVPYWLNTGGIRKAAGIGLLEVETTSEAGEFDFIVRTPPQPRPDPCKDLAGRMPGMPAR